MATLARPRRLLVSLAVVAALAVAAVVYEFTIEDGPRLDDPEGLVSTWRYEGDLLLPAGVPLSQSEPSVLAVREGERAVSIWWSSEACGDAHRLLVRRAEDGLSVRVRPDDGGSRGCEPILIVNRMRLDLAAGGAGPVEALLEASTDG